MKTKEKLNGYYNYTVILTYLGMLAGFTGIAFVMEGSYRQAMICLMISGICDMFDGTVAATKKDRSVSEKRFGVQIDSLSDLICFGVLPALLTYCVCEKTYLAFGAACLYVLCALIRLAYFNVMEEERQTRETGSRSVYQGLPVTVAALVFPLLLIVSYRFLQAKMVIMLTVLTIMAVAFVVPFEVKKPHWVGKMVIVIVGIVEFSIIVFSVVKV